MSTSTVVKEKGIDWKSIKNKLFTMDVSKEAAERIYHSLIAYDQLLIEKAEIFNEEQ